MNKEESVRSMETPTIGPISRKRLKKELKCSEIKELYLGMIREMNDDTNSISGSTVQQLHNVPNWILKDYDQIQGLFKLSWTFLDPRLEVTKVIRSIIENFTPEHELKYEAYEFLQKGKEFSNVAGS